MTKLAIVSATSEEQDGILKHVKNQELVVIAGRDFIQGSIHGIDVVVVLCGIGKVAAALTTTLLCEQFEVDYIVFTGVAGSLNPLIMVGDIVVADRVVQHDMDNRPMNAQYQVPGHQDGIYEPNNWLSEELWNATCEWLLSKWDKKIPMEDRQDLECTYPNIHCGMIATGDQFIRTEQQYKEIVEGLPEAIAVEMEGGAIGQVCQNFGVPFAIIRTISDNANESSHTDYPKFIERIASVYSEGIIKKFCKRLAKKFEL